MSISSKCLFLFLLPAYVYCADRNSSCITPNGETATCTPIFSCLVMQQALFSQNASAIEFAQASQCGFDTEPLVCCGSSGYYMIESAQSNLLPSKNVCGFTGSADRIFGGQITNIGEFPWMALLGYVKNGDNSSAGFKCGGTLINNRYVLTAAHCVRVSPNAEITLDMVRLGEWQISKSMDCDVIGAIRECSDPVIDLKIEKKIVHRNYSRRTGDNDIALVRLARNVRYTDFVRPICLPALNFPQPQAGAKYYVSGWGSTENGSTSDYKLKAEIPIVANDDCQLKFRNRGKISENQICAGGIKGRDACQGDSGGPLMKDYDNRKQENLQQWFQEGVVAWGIGCGGKDMPGVYTRVSNYVPWILENLSTF